MKAFTLASLLLLAPLSAHAADLDYTYIGAGWYGTKSDNFSNERGYGVQGSVALGDHWLVTGDYRFSDGRLADLSSRQFGVGYRFGLNERADLVAKAGYLQYRLDGPVRLRESSGFVELSTRFDAGPGFDWELGLRYADISYLRNLNLLANAQFKFGSWSLLFGLTANPDEQTLLVGPRYRF